MSDDNIIFSHKPYLACPIPDEIYRGVLVKLIIIRSNPGSREAAKLALEVIRDITEESLDFYFIQPIAVMELGLFSSQIVKIGVSTGIGVLNTFGSRLLGSLSTEQMIKLTYIVENSLVLI